MSRCPSRTAGQSRRLPHHPSDRPNASTRSYPPQQTHGDGTMCVPHCAPSGVTCVDRCPRSMKRFAERPSSPISVEPDKALAALNGAAAISRHTTPRRDEVHPHTAEGRASRQRDFGSDSSPRSTSVGVRSSSGRRHELCPTPSSPVLLLTVGAVPYQRGSSLPDGAMKASRASRSDEPEPGWWRHYVETDGRK